ncbi:MFS transporter [Demequina salsinemoris]|uniref:MFS transporter n=1 Tax=Demequina salsinemoris TaxID=577470 RepID=UPI000785C91D|nr:MFS transporter [Demequina salsinemoris]
MSSHTRTLELPALDELLARAPEQRGARPESIEPEPTTAAIPVVGGAEAVVIDEPERAVRSLAALTLSPRRAHAALLVLAAGAFATGANEASIIALSPSIATGLGVPVAQVGLLATAFALTVVVAAVPLTLLTARLSPRTTLTATLALWTTGVTIAATAGSFAQLAGGRIVSAAAHALFWALVAPTAANLFAPHLRAMTVTRIMVGGAAAGVVGTPLVTIAGEHLGWQAPYWGFAALGVVLVVALALTLPRPVRDDSVDPDDDLPPAPEHTRGDVPSMRNFARVLAVTFTAQVAMSATWTYIASYVTDVAGMPKATLPVLFALGGVLGVASTLAIGPHLARRAVHSVGLGVVGIGIAWVLLATGTAWGAVGGQIFQAAGWAALVAALLNWAMRHTPWRTDLGASTFMMTSNSGAAVGPIIGGAVLGAFGLAALPLVSLALTGVAAVLVATVDPRLRHRLGVSRSVRTALERRQALRDRRDEWARRTERTAPRSIAAAWSVGQQAARHADAALAASVPGTSASAPSMTKDDADAPAVTARAESSAPSEVLDEGAAYLHIASLQALDPYREEP